MFQSGLIDGGHNLESDAGNGCGLSSAARDLVGVEADLGPLGHYAHRLPTAPPRPGSPVIDAGGPAPCPTSTDERGQPRPVPPSRTCTIGAVEYVPAAG